MISGASSPNSRSSVLCPSCLGFKTDLDWHTDKDSSKFLKWNEQICLVCKGTGIHPLPHTEVGK